MAWIAWLRRFLALCFCIAVPLVAGLSWTARPGAVRQSAVPPLGTAPPRPVPLRIAATAPASRPRLVRVGLTPQPVASITLSVAGPFQITEPGRAKSLFAAQELASCRVTATSHGWRLGARAVTAPRLEITPRKSPAVWVNGRLYRGIVRLHPQSGGKLIAVNELPLEEYLASVIDSEMPAEFGDSARAAQAVVARTFALYQIEHASPDAPLDLYATTRSQKYLGYQYRDGAGRLLAGESDSSRRIAAETQGLVCTWQGRLFRTYYCAACGGATLLGTEFFSDAAPPLKSVPCDWCRAAPLAHWSIPIAKAAVETDLRDLLRDRGSDPGRLKKLTVLGTPVLGRMRQFEYQGERSNQRLTASEIRSALSERGVCSPTFSISEKNGVFTVTGRGNGHGVGLCQWGARGLDHAGYQWRQIIEHYYPGAKIEKRGGR